MDSVEKSGGRPPFKDLTNTVNSAGRNESNSLAGVVDAKERKRQRERERWASMSVEQRNEKNKRRREARQRMKAQSVHPNSSKDGDASLNKENIDPEESDTWLHRSETFQHDSIDIRVDMPEPVDFTTEYAENHNTMAVECTPGYHPSDSSMDFTNIGTDRSPGDKCLHQPSKFVADPLYTSESVNTTHNLGSVTPTPPAGPTKSRNNYFRERYRNLTPEQRIARQKRQTLHNTTSQRKESKRAYNSRQREIEKNTLNSESIAMENPKFTPEIVRPTMEASCSTGSSFRSCDLVIPELSPTPFVAASTQTEDVDAYATPPSRLKHKRHVPSGGRQSLLSRQNQRFQATIARNLAAPTEDSVDVGAEWENGTQPETTTKLINNVGPSIATYGSEHIAREGDNGTHLEMGSEVILVMMMMMKVSSLKRTRKSGLKAQFSMDGRTLRRNFIIDLLTYEGNSCQFSMPANVQKYLDRIVEKS